MDFIKTPPNHDSTDRILYSIEESMLSTIFSCGGNRMNEQTFITLE